MPKAPCSGVGPQASYVVVLPPGLPVFSFLLCVTRPVLKAASPVFPHSSSGTQPSTVSTGFQFDVFASCASLCNSIW